MKRHRWDGVWTAELTKELDDAMRSMEAAAELVGAWVRFTKLDRLIGVEVFNKTTRRRNKQYVTAQQIIDGKAMFIVVSVAEAEAGDGEQGR